MDNSGMDLCMLPAGPPPSGTVSNFDNARTLVPVLISMCVIMTLGGTFFTTCRVIANWGKMRWSDYFVIIALVLSFTQTGLMLAQTKYARHQWDVRACWYDGTYAKMLFSLELILSSVVFFSKASIFLLFNQIFETQRLMRIAIRFGIIFSALVCLTYVPSAAILSAPHIGETWASVLYTNRPQKDLIWGVVQAALSILLDLLIFVLPVPVILRLHLSTKKKIQLLAVFTTALVGVIASILSLIYRAEAIGTNDGTWKYTALLLCSVVENYVAIIVSCTPGFAHFTKVYISELRIVKSLRSTLNKSGATSKPTWNYEKNPNSPRTGRASGKKGFQWTDELSDTCILESTTSTERGEAVQNVSQPQVSPGILRTIDVSQESSDACIPATGGQDLQDQDYSAGVFCHGPGAV